MAVSIRRVIKGYVVGNSTCPGARLLEYATFSNPGKSSTSMLASFHL
jgi:hypothetical protein